MVESSGKELVGLGFLRKSGFRILMARLMVDSEMIHPRFQRMTCGKPASKKSVGRAPSAALGGRTYTGYTKYGVGTDKKS